MPIDDVSLLKSILENHQSAVFAIDLHYHYLVFNSQYERNVFQRFNIRIEKGMNVLDTLPSQEEKESLSWIFNSVFKGESILVNYKSPENQNIYEYFYYPLKTDDSIRGAVLFITDITERAEVEAKKALFMSRQKAISQMIPDFFVISSSNGVRKHVNKSYCDFFGFDPKDIIGKSYLESIPEQERQSYIETVNRMTPESPSITSIHLLEGHDGREQWTLWNETGIFDEAGNFVEIISIGRNINDIVEAREEREKYISVLEKAIFKTSHEIRQPIVNILGIAQLMESQKLSQEEAESTLVFIQQSALKLDQFTKDMNSFIHHSIENHKSMNNPFPHIKIENDKFINIT